MWGPGLHYSLHSKRRQKQSHLGSPRTCRTVASGFPFDCVVNTSPADAKAESRVTAKRPHDRESPWAPSRTRFHFLQCFAIYPQEISNRCRQCRTLSNHLEADHLSNKKLRISNGEPTGRGERGRRRAENRPRAAARWTRGGSGPRGGPLPERCYEPAQTGAFAPSPAARLGGR